MEVLPALENMESAVGDLKRTRCEQRFKIISDYKDAFGDKFDKLTFLNYSTGQCDITGAMLREAQTGCEIYEKLGWDVAEHNSEDFHKCGCKQFDEQLQFVSEETTDPESNKKKRDPLSNIDYRLTLGDGRVITGTTDNDGKTKRIKSATKAIAIEKAEFFVPDDIPRCPGKQCSAGSEEAAKTIKIDGIETNQESVGSSLQTVTVKVKSRPLTAGEIEMARLIFKDSIDYSKVRIHNEEYLPFGLQLDHYAMTPNGSMYFNPNYYVQDFSAQETAENEETLYKKRREVLERKRWFIHEMTHIWQYQLGYALTWHGFWIGVTGGYIFGREARAYKYDYSDSSESPDSNKLFSDFNMEQQAMIVESYFGIKYLYEFERKNEMKFYNRVLKEFLRRPNDASHLPK